MDFCSDREVQGSEFTLLHKSKKLWTKYKKVFNTLDIRNKRTMNYNSQEINESLADYHNKSFSKLMS